MRMGFGLVSILVVTGIILYLFSLNAGTDIKAGQKAQDQIRHMTNTGADGMRAGDSITLQEVDNQGRLTGMKVTSIVASGPMAINFGLLQGDTITRLDGARIGDMELADYDMAKALLFSPHGPDWHLTVDRGGQELTLPAGH